MRRKAAPGKLCLYVGHRLDLLTTGPYVFDIDAKGTSEEDSTANTFGAQIIGKAAAAGQAEYHGTYAVTAP